MSPPFRKAWLGSPKSAGSLISKVITFCKQVRITMASLASRFPMKLSRKPNLQGLQTSTLQYRQLQFGARTTPTLKYSFFPPSYDIPFLATLDCKTAPSFARSPKSGVFERVLMRGREWENGARKESRGQFLPFHDRASKLAQNLCFSDFWRRKGLFCSL